MGVEGFYGHWIKKLPVFEKTIPEVSSLSLDFNSILHQTMQETIEKGKSFSDYIAVMFAYIIALLEKFRPKDVFILAVDGIAPGAKLQQQKSRRERSAQENSEKAVTRIQITPGTEFMIKVDAELSFFFEKGHKLLPKTSVYSSHLSPGEAEHKIMEYYRNRFVINKISNKFSKHKVDGFIQKPYNVNDLKETIHHILRE